MLVILSFLPMHAQENSYDVFIADSKDAKYERIGYFTVYPLPSIAAT